MYVYVCFSCLYYNYYLKQKKTKTNTTTTINYLYFLKIRMGDYLSILLILCPVFVCVLILCVFVYGQLCV